MGKVLVVDNNPVILKAVSTILLGEEYEVRAVSTGLEALEVLDEFKPDIVFTDLVMPLVSGEQLCRIIRNTEKYQSIFIVVLSGIVLEDQERILRDVDCDVCIAKGNLSEIRLDIQEALRAFHTKEEITRTIKDKATRIPKGLRPSGVARELLLEKQHHINVISNLDEGILELNDEGKVVFANRAVLKILSFREEEIIGKFLPEIRHWDNYSAAIESWTRDQLINKGMTVLEIHNESPLVCDETIVSASMIPVREGDTFFGLCIFRDITRQSLAEQRNQEMSEAIRLAKKMDAMSCMAGGVAHDFNNLLTVICGNLDILAMGKNHKGDSNDSHLIEQAKKAALVAVDLTRQISCFSNFGIIKRNVCKANDIARRAVEEFFKNDVNASYVYTENSDSPLVSVDSEEIIAAINNILRNSREAFEDGTIKINVADCILENPELIAGQYVSAGEYVRIDIQDDGPGIDDDQIYQIFDPYYSTKERGASKGVGLGLTVVYATLRNHGGNVIVDSVKGQGTTVTLYIPVYAKSEASHIISVDEKFSNESVILVDSDKQMLEIGKIMLRHLGFSVVSVEESGEALLLLKNYSAGPDSDNVLVILDVSDMDAESARQTCSSFKEIMPAISIIAMCGTILDPVIEDYQAYGFDQALPKPYTADGLRHIIQTVLLARKS